MWLEAERTPDRTDCRLRHACRLRHRTCRRVSRVAAAFLEGLDDHSLDIVIGDGSWCSRSWLVVQRVDAMNHEPVAPLADRHPVHARVACDLAVGTAVRVGEHDPAPQRQRGARWHHAVVDPRLRRRRRGGRTSPGRRVRPFGRRCEPRPTGLARLDALARGDDAARGRGVPARPSAADRRPGIVGHRALRWRSAAGSEDRRCGRSRRPVGVGRARARSRARRATGHRLGHATLLVDANETTPGVARRLGLGLYPHLLTAVDRVPSRGRGGGRGRPRRSGGSRCRST